MGSETGIRFFLKMNIADIWAVCPKPKWCITPEPLTHVEDGFYRNPSLIFFTKSLVPTKFSTMVAGIHTEEFG